MSSGPSGSQTRLTSALTFGEAMIRVTPPFHERLESSTSWNPTVGGTELNAAVVLRILGIRSSWVSVLPNTGLGRFISRQAQAAGVDIDDVIWVDEEGSRLGLYFLDEGTVPRPSTILYDRRDSAFARMDPARYDWSRLLDGHDLLHVTGITLAVSESARTAAMDAMRLARERGIRVSFDPNYRSRLWSVEEAREAFQAVMPFVDVLFSSADALHQFFGIEGEGKELLRRTLETLGVDTVCMTTKQGETSRQLSIRSLAMNARGEFAGSSGQEIEVVDRIGGGDAFAGGFLAEYLGGSGDLERSLAIGDAASAIKHTMPGDFLRTTKDEIERIAFGGRGGLLQR